MKRLGFIRSLIGKPGPMRRGVGTTRQVRKEATDAASLCAVVSLAPSLTPLGGLGLPAGKFGVEAGVGAVLAYEVAVATRLDKAAVVQNENAAGVANRA